jgi:hypothetical protein
VSFDKKYNNANFTPIQGENVHPYQGLIEKGSQAPGQLVAGRILEDEVDDREREVRQLLDQLVGEELPHPDGQIRRAGHEHSERLKNK